MAGATLVALLALLSGHLERSQDAAAAQQSRLIVRYKPPPFALPPTLRDSIRFAWLDVPQDHNNPAAGSLRLAFAVLPARSSTPAAEPIVFIPGGPGMAAVEPWTAEAARSERIALLRQHRDFIILDPRGHGLSDPESCPELDMAKPLINDSPTAEAILAAKLKMCRAHLAAAGVQLETLSAIQAAHDLELLRLALGVRQLNLFGGSYGTRIVAETLRQHPGSIRAAVFLSPVPPGLPHLGDGAETASEVIGTLLRRCDELSGCRSAFPRLAAEYDSLIARVRRVPLRVSLTLSDRAPEGELVLHEAEFKEALSELLVVRNLAGSAPMVVHTLATHGLDAVAPLIPHLLLMLSDDDVRFGTNLAFHCNDSPVFLEAAAWLGTRCPPWVGQNFGDSTAASLQSEIPSLILTGELDPRTPPSYGAHLGKGLPNSYILSVPWHGHDLQHPCLSRIQRDFFDTPHVRPSTTCLDSLPPLAIVPRVIPSRWIASATGRLARAPGSSLAAGVPLILLLIGAFGAPLDRRNRINTRSGNLEFASTMAAAVVGLSLLISTAAAIVIAGRTSPLVAAIGVTESWGWILILPWLLLGLTAAMLLTGWNTDRQSRSAAYVRLTTLAGAIVLLGLWAILATDAA